LSTQGLLSSLGLDITLYISKHYWRSCFLQSFFSYTKRAMTSVREHDGLHILYLNPSSLHFVGLDCRRLRTGKTGVFGENRISEDILVLAGVVIGMKAFQAPSIDSIIAGGADLAVASAQMMQAASRRAGMWVPLIRAGVVDSSMVMHGTREKRRCCRRHKPPRFRDAGS